MDARNDASLRLAARPGMCEEARFRSSEMFEGDRADSTVLAVGDDTDGRRAATGWRVSSCPRGQGVRVGDRCTSR